MCGICGYIYFDEKREVDFRQLKEMNSRLIHRGPDDEGYYVNGNVGLAMRRLSIIDIETGFQPMSDEAGRFFVVANGEIYNHRELRQELVSKGHQFNSNSDIEIIPHLYEQRGVDLFEKLSGMFGIAIWDSVDRKLVLARDFAGKKPLYYAVLPWGVIFASELKALLAHREFEPVIDRTSVAKYLAYEYVPSPRSIFEGVRKVEPGQMVEIRDGFASSRFFWDVPIGEQISPRVSFDEAGEELVHRLKGAIKRRLMSEVPLGVFLSGGIDSSTIAALLSTIVPAKTIKTFSIAFEEPSFDESSYARCVAELLGTDHHEQFFKADDLVKYLPEIDKILDEPLGDASILPTYLLSKFSRERITVALGGDGGDELLAGYPTFQADRLTPYYRLLPRMIREGLVESIINRLPVSPKNFSLDFKLKQFVKGLHWPAPLHHMVWVGSFDPGELTCLMGGDFRAEDVYSEVLVHKDRCVAKKMTEQILYIYKKTYLADDVLAKVDRASMAVSLEVRAPFLDRDVIEWAARMPYRWKLRCLTTKYLLKRAMKGYLPGPIINRSKKGFGIPVAAWLNGRLNPLMHDLLAEEKLKREGWFNPGYVARLMKEHEEGRFNHRKKLWTLMMFETWLERYGRSDAVIARRP